MSGRQADEVVDVLDRVSGWPARKRLALARQILETLEPEPEPEPRPRAGRSFMDLLGLLKVEGPPPSDEDCEKILEVELLRKYDR